MSFKEWLDKQCEKRAKCIKTPDDAILKIKFDTLVFNNGESMSVQASEWHACEPRETLKKNEYISVEVLGDAPQLKYWETDGIVKQYVDIETMEEIALDNGGIKDDPN